MPRKRRKKEASEAGPDENISRESGVRQDLPEKSSIIGEKEFTSPKGNKYRIILTDEGDPYDKTESLSKSEKKTE